MKKIIGFGDMLVSLSPPGYNRFIQSDSMNVNYTGAEANVLVSLSQLGLETSLVTRLPDNAIGDCAMSCMRKFGVNINDVIRGGDRMGVIYTEKGASQRASNVIYDRKHTSVSTVQPQDFDWNHIFEDAEWFHFTGITPALSDSCAEVCMDACRVAKSMGITVSCDLNYRKKLWTEEKAQSVMEPLIRYVDVLIANEEDAEKVLGIKADNTNIITGSLDRAGYIEVARRLCETYGVRTVGITLRKSFSASDNAWSAMLYNGHEAFFSKEYSIHIVNRVGGGDSFTAALIYALEQNFTDQDAIEFAAASSCLKHSIEGDFNLVSVAEVKRLVNGDSSGRVQR